MNWINNVVRPKIRSFLTTKRDVPDDLWRKCPETGQMVFTKDLVANQYVYPGSDYHERMTAPQRFQHLFGGENYAVIPNPSASLDPLKFRDAKRYTDRLKEAKAKTSLEDAVVIAEGDLDGTNVVVAVQDFHFMAGSLGMAAGEAVIAGMEHAVSKKSAFILFAASGGARMQEGIMSLMQMPRTTIAVQRLREARLPYIVVLTDPTTGGVTASYAMLGDVHIAEPGALICFAGPRVIQQTIREQLPDGFQRAEYLRDHGMIDMVVHRHKLRQTLARLVRVLMAPARTQTSDVTNRKPSRGLNGAKSRANGTSPDITDQPASGSVSVKAPAIIEAEPVSDNERFEPGRRARGDTEAKTVAETKPSETKTAPKS